MKYMMLLLTILVATNCREEPVWVTVSAGVKPTPTTISLSAQATLLLADYPPQENPYWFEGNDFWLVHTLEGELFAFAPKSPDYVGRITVDECRYTWNEINQRFIDPCSGDEWELNGTLNLEHSTELWSDRDLDQYLLSLQGEQITIQLEQRIPGRTILPASEEIATTNSPGDETLLEPELTATPASIPTEAAIKYPTLQSWETFTSTEYGFSLQHPPEWTPVDTLPNQISLVRQGTGIALRLLVRRVEDEINLVRSGVPAGEFSPREPVIFLGQPISSTVLVYQNRNKAVFYEAADEIPRGNLVFVISLESNLDYETTDIPLAIQTDADAILSSVKWIEVE